MTRTALIELMNWAMSHSKTQQAEIAALITRQQEDFPDKLLNRQDIEYFMEQVAK